MGPPFVRGRAIAAPSQDEEREAGGVAAPSDLQARPTGLGAIVGAAEAWMPHVVADGRLVTGRNAQSSAALAAAVLAILGT